MLPTGWQQAVWRTSQRSSEPAEFRAERRIAITSDYACPAYGGVPRTVLPASFKADRVLRTRGTRLMDEPENSNSVTAVQSPDEAVPVTSMWTPGDTSVPWNCYHSPDGGAKKGLSFEGIRRAVESRTGIFTSFDQTALRDIFNVKKLVLSLRRHLVPERDVFAVLTNRPNSLLSAETQVYFRDIHDHILRINDALETYRELLSNVLDGYLTQVSNRLGSITKTLSVVATVSIPFVVISGMWGMNFERIPLQGWSHGFWFMLVLQLALGGLLLAVLRWRKLL